MSESRIHIELVQIAKNYIINSIPEHYAMLVQMDSPDTSRPQMIGSFIPDVFLETQDLLIIGEAKTYDDFDREHSKQQYNSYLKRCSLFQGKSRLVISVPWQLVPTAKNYFRLTKKNNKFDVEIVIVNELGKAYII